MNNVLKKEQVIEKLRNLLKSGELAPGSKLKSGITLAQEFNVSHITVRSALKELSSTGELLVIHGRGIFVPLNKTQTYPKILAIRQVDNIESPAQYAMPEFISKVSEKGGTVVSINIQFIRNNPSSEMISVLRNSGYTAILLEGSNYLGNEPEIDILHQLDLPVLIIHATKNDVEVTGFNVLDCDIEQAWLDGLKAILSTQRKRIALLLCSPYNTKFRGRTIEEHLQLLAQNGADSDPELIQICSRLEELDSDEDIALAVNNLLSLKNRPQAIYCFSDFIALKVYEILQSKNIRIPEDIAVMGFCGYPGGVLLNPPLATVDENYALHGQIAAEKLCDTSWYNKNNKPFYQIAPHKVCIRKSIT
jgi:DNA-binding LacI/PurR family transcriptional regulator